MDLCSHSGSKLSPDVFKWFLLGVWMSAVEGEDNLECYSQAPRT